ncbi:hypothetical protein [Fusobacterium polymorphum]|uniref:hypothetical protein n=1 Tax=Fusobacterium nucleatum subsp. polymorphum TaxID=76857 RepID=UPI002B4BAD7F|nr:hypothetical protein [Fusobacterium polymorphum]WRL74320.1 hypothetical protein VKN80_06720 [Fusobacterium polymorphum]
MNTVYKDRYIVFIDILGFKDIVNKSNNDNKKAEEILENLKYIERIKKENDEIFKLTSINRKVTIFSDSIKKNITSHLNNKDYSEEVLKKYRWFVNYYNNSIERIIKEFKGNPKFFEQFFIEK